VTASFDLVVIGTGSGGSAPAYRCRRAGWRVAVVDALPFGGTCALRGCDPKKVLVGAAEVADVARRLTGRGITGDTRISWAELMRFKRSFTDPVPDHRVAAFQRAGIECYHGPARFVAPDQVAVDGQTLTARHFVIAAGAKPRHLGIPGEEHVLTSTQFLELDQLPARLAFVGAGYISFEFAHVAQRAGAQAIIIGRGQPLKRFDADLVARLVEHTRRLGVELKLGMAVTAVERRGSGFTVELKGPDGKATVEVDQVVHGGGRVPDTQHLDLPAAEVAVEPGGGVRVNAFLQSPTNPRVYAAGDVAASPGAAPLTPVAGYQGTIVASNLLEGNHRTPDYRGVPSVAFTIPPLAAVGLTEAEARAQGIPIRVTQQDTSGWYSARRVAETCAMAKVVLAEGEDRILGAHLLGPHAEEVINLFALAIRSRLPASDLKHQLYAYPTSGSDVPYLL
jgi:glutathione reductase (NADPH)